MFILCERGIMKQILLCTHGEFAKGILNSLELIAGTSHSVEAICVSAEDSMETVKGKIQAFVDKYDEETNKIILTDIMGGSPTQASFHVMATNKNVYVVSGLNLGLLLEIALSAEEDVEHLLKEAIIAGRETMQLLNDALNQ